MFNITQGPSANMTLGTWFLVEALYNNAITDFLRIGGTTVTGTNVGNNDQAAHALFGLTSGVGANCSDSSCAKNEIFAGLPTFAERAAMLASDIDFFGAGSFVF
jgi:hypothetical protein